MANTTRASGFLPSIKCSNCNIEIPISMMGEHVCSQAPPLPSSRLDPLNAPFAPTILKQTMGTPFSRPQKPIPPRLNATSTFDSIFASDQRSPKPVTSNTAGSASPAIHSYGPKPSFSMPFLRTSTSPLPSRPASPVLSTPQDSAFPPFPSYPTARSRSTTPTTPLEPRFNGASKSVSPRERMDTDYGHARLNPRANGGGDLMQRMDNIAPGPLNLREHADFKPSGHKKSPSMGSSRDFVKVSRSASPQSDVQRPSTSSSNYTHTSSLQSISAGPRSMLNRSKTETPVVPSTPRPYFQDQSDGSAHVPLPSFDFGSFGNGNRSRTVPSHNRDVAPSESRPIIDRVQSESSSRSHKARPSVAEAAMKPLYDIGSTSSFKPSRSVRGRAVSPAMEIKNNPQSVKAEATDSRDDRRLGNAPPVPMPVQASESYGYENQYHKPHESSSSDESYSSVVKSGSSISTPHESTSSNESYSFDMKGDGLRSGPPLNDSPKNRNGNASGDNQPSDMFKGFVFDVEEPSIVEEPAPMQDEPIPAYIQPSRINDAAPLYPVKATLAPHEEAPLRSLSPATSLDEYLVSSFTPQMNHMRVSPTPPAHFRRPEPSARRPTPTNKGNCRGCGGSIQGKSVSSADGRLTGRYHKQCFVCQTCQRPFPSADFYVLNNQPYCARHYHELNDSLCTNCDRGIEGQYLETEPQQKFHPYCFSCQDCHIILRDDYFEFNGKTLCEQHAFGAARTSTPSSLGPGRRFPERRTTRLMMM